MSQPPGVNHRILVLDLSEERSRTVGVFVASSASASFVDAPANRSLYRTGGRRAGAIGKIEGGL